MEDFSHYDTSSKLFQIYVGHGAIRWAWEINQFWIVYHRSISCIHFLLSNPLTSIRVQVLVSSSLLTHSAFCLCFLEHPINCRQKILPNTAFLLWCTSIYYFWGPYWWLDKIPTNLVLCSPTNIHLFMLFPPPYGEWWLWWPSPFSRDEIGRFSDISPYSNPTH